MTMSQHARPFADTVVAYAQAGWPCIFPVPIAKAPPPEGFTGADGRDTDPLQLVQWSGSHPDSSIALRMPDGVIGIDVDAYPKGNVVKHGDVTLAELVEKWGPLPATWTSTARGAGQPSRIHFFRVPEQRYVTRFPDVEIVQRHHRYAVVWPSPHPEIGDVYRWYDPAGAEADLPPKPIELPDLPETWIAGLLEGATNQGPPAADVGSGQALLLQLAADTRSACPEITSAALTAVAELTKADAGSRHDTATGRVHQLVQLAAAGHPGLGNALTSLGELWDQLTAGEDRADEWERMLLTSARKAVSVVGVAQVAHDPCALIGGIPIATPGGPAPGEDRPGEEAPDPIEPPKLLHPLEVIGGHVFDTRANLDQRLAEAVLERMYPVLRYGYDAKAWLLRRRADWDVRGEELAEWAVAQVADLVPRGDPDADKGTIEREQAERRKRLMSAGPSGAVAKKIRAVVASGAHPCAVSVSDLDSEPWLLWAGGMPWDLTLSSEGPTLSAMVDPSTPHMRAAGVAPDLRPTPLWDSFIAAVWPDPELRAWALRVLSIAVTGYCDKALPILVGEKDRGKTQVIALVMSVLGSYAHAADPRLLNGLDNAHASIIYALKGRRLSFIDEGPREGRLGQERLKQLTGGGDLTGNQMNRNPITFSPTHTLVLTANDEPLLTDPAIRGRVRLIPCEGDPVEVRKARKAIGHTTGRAWRREAPGVLAKLMREAAGWLADQDSALTVNAPEAYRFRAEEIANEQDPTSRWVTEETEPYEPGSGSRELYKAFVSACLGANQTRSQIPSETKWARELNRLGYPGVKRRDGNYRQLRVKAGGGWIAAHPIGGGSAAQGGRFAEGSPDNPPQPEPPDSPGLEPSPIPPVEGVEGLHPSYAHVRTHTHARTHAHEDRSERGQNPPQPSAPSTPSISSQISARLLAGRGVTELPPGERPAIPGADPAKVDLRPNRHGVVVDVEQRAEHAAELAALAQPAAPSRRGRLSDEEKAQRAADRTAARAAAKLEERAAAIAAAGGGTVTLPAVVTRDGTVREISTGRVRELLAAFGGTAELTVDVEHTGFPVGHADYALRTVQVGTEHAAIVYDADDPDQLRQAGELLAAAAVLHAHSATADLVPLAVAGALDIDDAWALMHDTVIPAKLSDPAMTGSDPDLKKIAAAVLGDHATSPAADEARAALFKAGRWLTDTKPTTPIERSGWAQVDKRSVTMVRYAAADVLDDAALARVLPAIPPDLLERERTAQLMTARVAHRGLRIDGEHVAELTPVHRAALGAAADRLKAFGVEAAGSDHQVAQAALRLGAQLPATPGGKPSVAKGALERYRKLDNELGEFVRARLDYQHHETALGLFLDPYTQLVQRGDGRARPTVYTLGADTGRMSCVRPNLQQVPREGGMRACITADPGTLLVSADFAGVELRVAAALSGDRNLQRMLAEGADLHWIAAREVYGPEATKADRYDVKRGVFGWLYGGGIPTLARQMGVNESTAAALVGVLAGIAPELVAWTESVKAAVKAGHTQFPSYSGRVIHLPVRRPHAAPNYCIQGTARELLIDALMRLRDTAYGATTLLPVHDEVLLVVPEDQATDALATLTACMESELHGVAIKAEASQPSFAWQDAA